jgi:hypothetical protein
LEVKREGKPIEERGVKVLVCYDRRPFEKNTQTDKILTLKCDQINKDKLVKACIRHGENNTHKCS